MKRKFESGASKRRRKELAEEAAKTSMTIFSFLKPSESALDPSNTTDFGSNEGPNTAAASPEHLLNKTI